MSAELANLRREFSLTIASCFYENQEHVRAIELLYRFRASEPEEFRPAATRALLCQLLIHYSPESLRRVFEIELSQLALADQRLFSSALAVLVDEEVANSDLIGLEQASEHEWLWHFPLGWDAWRKHDRLRAWRHFERFLNLERQSGYSGGWMREKARVLSFWERTCEICQEASAHDFYRSSDLRRLAICPACQELRELEPLAARCELERSDAKMKLLGRREFVPELLSRRKWPKQQTPPPPSPIPLAYRRTSTLLKQLSPEAVAILERARKLSSEAGQHEANSCSILAAFTIESLPSWLSNENQEETQRGAKARIALDSPHQLTMILNIASWHSTLSVWQKKTIDQESLLIGALYCENGLAWSVWIETAPTLVWLLLFPLHHELLQARRPQLQSLHLRYPRSIYLRCVLAGIGNRDTALAVDEQCNFLQTAPDRVPYFSNWHRTTWSQRASLLENWRNALMKQDDLVLLSLCSQSVDFYFPELGCAALLLAARRNPEDTWWWRSVARNGQHPHASRHQAVQELENTLNTAHPGSEIWSRHGVETAQLIFELGEKSKAEAILARIPYAEQTLHRQREIDELAFKWALAFGCLETAEHHLLQMPRPLFGHYFELAVKLWSRGRREAFWKALARLRDEPEAEPVFVDSVATLFQTKEAYWTQEMIDEARATREALVSYDMKAT